jgi:prohibitin 2
MNRARDFFVNSATAAARSATGGGGNKGNGGGGGGGGGLPITPILAMLGLGGISYGAYHSVVTVQPGHLGIIYNRVGGLANKATCNVGLNFVIPWFQRLVIFDTRTRPEMINSTSGSKDLQMVQISLRVLFRPDPSHLSAIYRQLGKDYQERVLPSIVNEVTKAVVAQYNASELLTKREAVSRQINVMLTKRAADFHILLDDVSITHLAFSKEYTAAVEAKQVAQQDSERAKYIVEKALQEKKSIVIKAEGEAESAMLIGNVCCNLLCRVFICSIIYYILY